MSLEEILLWIVSAINHFLNVFGIWFLIRLVSWGYRIFAK